MKKSFGVALVLLLVAIALFFFFNAKKTNQPTDLTPAQNFSVSPSENPSAKNGGIAKSSADAVSNLSETVSSPETNLAARAGELIADTNVALNLPPEIVLQNVRRAVRQFGQMFGGNPVGDNSEITSQLNGNNPKQINFIDPSAGMRLNEKGELVDAWNTPYFFHQLSASDMEIHSAGPDRKMWTDDDLMTK